MSEDKLDKPSQIQFAEAITANIPQPDKTVLPWLAAAYVATKVHKSGRKRR